jgi:predicted nucleic acid-binding protein
MAISLDTNVWIFGLFNLEPACHKILLNLSDFEIVVPNQIRVELERNLPQTALKTFYQLASEAGVRFDFADIPASYLAMFEASGLKKGDAVIGAYCEWQKIETIVSDNRDFLKGLSAGHSFKVMSPQEFCDATGL